MILTFSKHRLFSPFIFFAIFIGYSFLIIPNSIGQPKSAGPAPNKVIKTTKANKSGSVDMPLQTTSKNYTIIDLGINAITQTKPLFTIVGKNMGSTAPKWIKVQIFGITNSFASQLKTNTRVVDCQITKWSSSLIQIKAPSKLAGGFYRVQITIGKTVYNLNTRLAVAGVSHYELENSTVKNISKSNSTNSTTLLVIKGVGFGKAHLVNFIKIGNERIQNFTLWNDTVVAALLPLTIKPGFVYDVTLRNNMGVQFTSLYDKESKFQYPGISSVISNIDENGKLKGKVIGSGFFSFNQENPKNISGELFFNDIKISNTPVWKDNQIEFVANFLRAGKYLPKVVIKRKEKISGKIKPLNLYSRDSIYITSKINYSVKKIFGAYYALSLRETKSNNQKFNNYSSFIYTLPEDAKISLSFYDPSGMRKVGILITPEKIYKKGRYEIIFIRTDLIPGRYLFVLEVDKNIRIPYPFINE